MKDLMITTVTLLVVMTFADLFQNRHGPTSGIATACGRSAVCLRRIAHQQEKSRLP